MRIFGKISKGTQKNCLAIILYAIKEYFQKNTKRPLNPMIVLSQMIYLVYVKIRGAKNII